MNAKMRGLKPRYLQVDEIWSFVQKKRGKARGSANPEIGDQWVFVAIDEETKLVPSLYVGKRTRQS
jgi:hypothetical protein